MSQKSPATAMNFISRQAGPSWRISRDLPPPSTRAAATTRTRLKVEAVCARASLKLSLSTRHPSQKSPATRCFRASKVGCASEMRHPNLILKARIHTSLPCPSLTPTVTKTCTGHCLSHINRTNQSISFNNRTHIFRRVAECLISKSAS